MKDIDSQQIAAVFVTFNPDSHFSQNVKALASQVAAAVIIDNNSAPEQFEFVKSAKTNNVEIIRNKENEGIAKALNQGAAWALQKKYSWVLLMDQDSLAEDDMLIQMIKAYEEALQENNAAALIGVNFVYTINGKAAFTLEHKGKSFFKTVGVQTSGSLLSLNMYESTGPFREDFFIDYVDTEYCLRLKNKGHHAIIACKALMRHGLGTKGASTLTANYSPLRRYYRMRNELVTMREYLFKNPWWVGRHALYMLYEYGLVLTTEDNRRKKLRAMIKGSKDALTGRMGKTFDF